MKISIQSLSDASSDVFSKAAASHWSNNNLVGGSPTDNDASSNVVSPDDVAKIIIASLNDPLKQYCEDFINSKCPSSANEKVDNFEIATRGHLLSLVQTLLNANECNDIAVIEESIEDILRFFRGAIDIAVYVAKNTSLDVNTVQLRKLPFVLIEDVVETIPISLTQIIWKYGPSVWLQSILCQSHLNMFHQGSRYCLIRMCNKLLKNLSVSSQDEAAHFAGEISLTLASVFPLSERSAVNVLGAFHTDEKYQVEHETLEEWTENSSGEGGSSVAGTTKTSGGKNMALSYGFYSKFWSIQKIFTDPRGLLPKNGANWNQNMERFIMDVQDILGAFDGYKFSNDLVKHLNEKLEAMMRKVIRQTSQLNAVNPDVSGDVEMEDMTRNPSPTSNMTKAKRQYKYLTSSHLLHLQLQDPELRIHFLSQLLIISSFLSKSLSEAMSSTNGNTIADKVVLEKFQNDLQGMEKNAEELMRQIPPNGESHLNTLKWILHDREIAWQDWKNKKCSPCIEKFTKSVKNTVCQTTKLDSGKDGSINSTALRYIYDLNLVKDLPKISREMSQQQSMMDGFFEEYVDALDPDAGIEKEYLPKNNMLSCWRALRLITKNHIGHLGERDGKSMMNKKTGDFEGIVRHIWKNEKGIEIPGEMPSSESFSDDENLEDQLHSNTVASGDLRDEKERENEGPLDLKANDVKDPDMEKNEKGAITLEVDEKIEDIKMPSTENDLTEGDEKEAGEISDVNELSSTKDESTPTNETNATNEEEVIIDHGDEETHAVSNAGTGVHDSEQEPSNCLDDAGKSGKLRNLDTKIIDDVTVDDRDDHNGVTLNDQGGVGQRRRREESDQSENDDNKRRRKDPGTANLDTLSEKQQPQESDQKGEEKVQESVNAPSAETNDSTLSGKHDVEKNVESSTILVKEGSTSKVQESVHASSTETNDSTLSRKHDVEKPAKSSTALAKVGSASIDRKTPQVNENASLKSDSAVKATSNVTRDDVRRSNTKYGTQSGSHSFNNPSGNRRGDNRRQENRPRSPRPPPRREHTRESRSGHGTHTRFFSPDGRDDWAMANRGGREYGARGHGDMGNMRANKNDGRGQNRWRDRR